MGPAGPKPDDVDGDESSRERKLTELEDAVNDAILTGRTEDIVLATLIRIVANSIDTERPLFPNPLKEPVFYARYFLPWVKAGVADAAEMQKAIDKGMQDLLKDD